MSWDLDFVRDVRHGLRLLRTRPLLSALAILILAFGTGSTVAVFSFIDRLILRSPPLNEPDRVMTLWQTSADEPAGREGFRRAPSLNGGTVRLRRSRSSPAPSRGVSTTSATSSPRPWWAAWSPTVSSRRLVALAACYLPARRATRVDPLTVLKAE